MGDFKQLHQQKSHPSSKDGHFSRAPKVESALFPPPCSSPSLDHRQLGRVTRGSVYSVR